MKDEKLKEVLVAAGRLSNAARKICGGSSPFAFGHVEVANLLEIGEAVKKLRKAVDEYDEKILNFEEERENFESF